MSKQQKATITTTSKNIISQSKRRSASNSSTDEIEQQQSDTRMAQNILLIWLDNKIDTNNGGYSNTIKQLRYIINTIHTFTDLDQCTKFLNNIGDEKICMIMSGSLGQQIVPTIHSMSQIVSMFIVSKDKKTHEQWTKEWVKIRGIFAEINLIYENLKELVQECERNTIPMSLINTDDDLLSQNLDQLDSSFIYSQIFKEIFLTIEFNQHNFKKFIKYCRKIYSNNDKVLEKIKKFKREYRHESPISWYNSNSFLYPILNRALRTMDIEVLVKMGFFISDLHRQIEQLHSEEFNNKSRSNNNFKLYRGQGISKTTFEKMSKIKNGLLSFNNFLFTTKDRDLSFDIARHSRKNPDIIGILFVMTIHSSPSPIPFASINNRNSSKDNKDDVIFSMNTIFRINDIQPIGKHQQFYQVDLTFINDNDQDYRTLQDRIRNEHFPDEEGWYRLGLVLLKLGQLDKIPQAHKTVLERTKNESEKATICSQLGLAKFNQKEYKEAITFYEKALEIYNKTPPSNYLHLTGTYNNIGNVYYEMGNYTKALSSYETALNIQQQVLPPNHPDLNISYANIGLIYGKMDQYTKALPFYEKALEIQQRTLPADHPDLAASYNNIGALYDELKNYEKALWFYENTLRIQLQSPEQNPSALAMSYINIGNLCHSTGDYTKALSYYETGIQIQEQSLPSNHLDLAFSYNKLGAIYEDIGDYSLARSSYEKALEIRKHALPSNHSQLAESYNNMGNIYFNIDDYPNALLSYEKALEIQKQILPSNHSTLAASYNNIGAVYDKIDDYSKALLFYEKALAIRTQSLPPNHPDLALSYSNIGVVYDKMGQYEKALSSYEAAIQIQQQSLPPNHPDLASSYNNIGAMYEDMRNYSQALSFYKTALEIRQQSLQPNHPDLIVSYNNIATVYHYMKQYSETISYYEKALAIEQQSLPLDHPDLAAAYNKLGAVYEDMRNYSKARTFYEYAVDIGQRALPTDHPHLQMYTKNFNDIKQKS